MIVSSGMDPGNPGNLVMGATDITYRGKSVFVKNSRTNYKNELDCSQITDIISTDLL